MRIMLSMDSTGLAYFPGLAQSVEIDSKQLPDEEAEQLERLVDEAQFFEQPRSTANGARRFTVPDARQYNLTIVDGRRRRTLTLCDPIEDPAMQALLSEVQEWASDKRETQRETKGHSKRGKGKRAGDE